MPTKPTAEEMWRATLPGDRNWRRERPDERARVVYLGDSLTCCAARLLESRL